MFLILSTSCKSQQVVNLYMDEYERLPGKYYKDIQNKLDTYVGTWVYTNGTTSLKIVLQKRLHIFNSYDNCYEDELVGAVQYSENNVDIINTLDILDNTNDNEVREACSISGNVFWQPYYRPLCLECDEFVKRIRTNFHDSERAYIQTSSYIGFKEDLPNNKIIFYLRAETSALPEADSPQNTRVPEGTYVLTKVP